MPGKEAVPVNYQEVADFVIRGEWENAIFILKRGLGQSSVNDLQLNKEISILEDLGALEKKAGDALWNTRQKRISLTLKGQTRELRILHIDGNMIQAEEFMGPAIIPLQFPLASLKASELSTLANVQSPEPALLYRAVSAIRENHLSWANTVLLKTESLIAKALVTKIESDAASSLEDSALAALQFIHKASGLPSPAPGADLSNDQLKQMALSESDKKNVLLKIEHFKNHYSQTETAKQYGNNIDLIYYTLNHQYKPGLVGSYWSAGKESQAPLLIQVESTLDFNWKDRMPALPNGHSALYAEWEGQIEIKQSGKYTFIPSSPMMTISIKNEAIAKGKSSKPQTLNSGMYSFRVTCKKHPNNPKVAVMWKSGNKQPSPVPSSALFHDPIRAIRKQLALQKL
jgi:hypothetical protein